MAIDIFDPAILVGYASSFFAVIIALYNLYKARRPASLDVSPLIEVGTLSFEQSYLFYFPFLFFNKGAQSANLEWIDLEFKDRDSKEDFTFYLTKKVEGRKYSEIKRQLPLFPILIPGNGESTHVVLEFTEGKKKKLVLDRHYDAYFTFHYNLNKKFIFRASLELKSNQFISEIKWINLKQKIKDPEDFPTTWLFGKDMV